MVNVMEVSTEELKNSGNEAFMKGKFHDALNYYCQALELIGNKSSDLRLTIYKNRAITRINLNDFSGAEEDCNKALEINPQDTKALYRRALARQGLDKVGSAYQDAKQALQHQPNEKSIIELCATLVKENAQRLKKVESTENKVSEMLKLSFSNEESEEQKIKGINNLLVLCRDCEEGARKVWQNGAVISQLLAVFNNPSQYSDEFALYAVRVLDELAKSAQRAFQIMETIGIPTLTRLLAVRCGSSANVDAVSALLQRVFNALAAMDRNREVKPDNDVVERNKLHIVRLILELEEIITDPQYTAPVREACLDVLLKNLMHMDGGLPRGWSWRFVEDRGLFKLLHLACQIPELCEYPVSAETRQHVAIFLARLYDDMVFDTRRTIFKDKVDQFFNGAMTELDSRKGRIKLAALLITLLQGPVDTGISLVTNDVVTRMMLEMAADDGDALQQSVAVELIVLTVSKHERATAILESGQPVLHKLFRSKDDGVRVRALVGLCKCASAGGGDLNRQTVDDDTTMKLAAHCKAFLLDVYKYSVDVRRFACEGLSYLSLDANVKEFIVDDPLLLKALVVLAKSAGALCVFTLSAIYVNLCNAYEKPKVDEEMVQLAKFAKHPVPQPHPKDGDEFVAKRVQRLVKDGAVVACVAVSKIESRSALDNLARLLLAFTTVRECVGQVISEGGAKLLLNLYKECSAEGKLKAAHAIAKLGVTSDPDIAFPGQRCFEVVKPMIDLLHPEVDGLANYDALLTLTNLASKGEPLCKRIVGERAVPRIEEFWFDVSHEMLRSAAAELLLNLMYYEEFYNDLIKPGNDRLKMWVLLCDEGEDRLRLASSAGFALLTENESACQRILNELTNWSELFCELAMAEHPEVQRRCLMAIANMVEANEKIASEIMASEVFRILVAITKLDGAPERQGSKTQAQRALNAAEKKWDIIRATDRQLYEKKGGLEPVAE